MRKNLVLNKYQISEQDEATMEEEEVGHLVEHVLDVEKLVTVLLIVLGIAMAMQKGRFLRFFPGRAASYKGDNFIIEPSKIPIKILQSLLRVSHSFGISRSGLLSTFKCLGKQSFCEKSNSCSIGRNNWSVEKM
ncbi:hypothetical protein SUGI_0087890 [Cryptomeria japonica]|nr:hypothetical protein SUGI_0087890 [Cryptomeria japonica]